MIPILFEPKTVDFSTNGLGRLVDAISCKVTEELNGPYELEMKYPVTGSLFSEIKHSYIIAALNCDGGTLQAFRIYEITVPLNGQVTIYAEHISYQTNWIPMNPFEASSLQDCLAKLKSSSAETNPFTFWTNKSITSPISFLKPKSLRAMLGGEEGSVLQTYKGEYEWNNYEIRLWNKRGSDNGVVLRYGKNITTIEQETNIENTYTGVYPYYYDDENENLITLPEKVIHTNQAQNFPFQRTSVIDMSDKFEETPTIGELRAVTNSYITENNIGHPNVSIKVEFVPLWESTEYKDLLPLERVKLGDTVTVIFETLGIEETSEVIEYDFDVLKERYNSIQVGDPKSSLADTLVEVAAEIELVQNAAKEYATEATRWLTKGDGYLYIVRGSDGTWRELIAMDTPNVETAKKVLRINQYGIGFSDKGVDGPFYQAWTLDGVLSLGGLNNAYGELKLLDPDGNEIGGMNSEDIWLRNFFINSYGLTFTNSSGRVIARYDDEEIAFYEGNSGTTNRKILSINYDGISMYNSGKERLRITDEGIYTYNKNRYGVTTFSLDGFIIYDGTANQYEVATFDTNGLHLYTKGYLKANFTQDGIYLYGTQEKELITFTSTGGLVLKDRYENVIETVNDSGIVVQNYYNASDQSKRFTKSLFQVTTDGLIMRNYNSSNTLKNSLTVDANGIDMYSLSGSNRYSYIFDPNGLTFSKNGNSKFSALSNGSLTLRDDNGNIVLSVEKTGLALNNYSSNTLRSKVDINNDGIEIMSAKSNESKMNVKLDGIYMAKNNSNGTVDSASYTLNKIEMSKDDGSTQMIIQPSGMTLTSGGKSISISGSKFSFNGLEGKDAYNCQFITGITGPGDWKYEGEWEMSWDTGILIYAKEY